MIKEKSKCRPSRPIPPTGTSVRVQTQAKSLYLSHTVSYINTGKSLSEALIFASTNQQYDDRLFIVHGNFKLRILAQNMLCTHIVVFVLF